MRVIYQTIQIRCGLEMIPIDLCHAVGNNHGAIILYSEIFQNTPSIRRLAQQFASFGYKVYLPHIFHQYISPSVPLEYSDADRDRGLVCKNKKDPNIYDTETRALLDYIKHEDGVTKVSVIGFCFGGYLALRSYRFSEINFIASFYGTDILSEKMGRGKTLFDELDLVKRESESCLISFFWGDKDPHIPDADRIKIYQHLLEKKYHFTWHQLLGEHAFMRDEGARFDPMNQRIGVEIVLQLLHSR